MSSFINSFALSGTGDIFAGTQGGGVFLSTNNGTSGWTAINSGLISADEIIQSLAVSGNYVFARTSGRSVWRRPLSEMVGITTLELKKGPQKQSSLEIIASGRGNSRVMIGFSLGWQEKVSVKVYNLSGMLVASLVDGDLGAGEQPRGGLGTKSVQTGCYAVRMQAGEKNVVKSILISR